MQNRDSSVKSNAKVDFPNGNSEGVSAQEKANLSRAGYVLFAPPSIPQGGSMMRR
jgi:hypothetical protein